MSVSTTFFSCLTKSKEEKPLGQESISYVMKRERDNKMVVRGRTE